MIFKTVFDNKWIDGTFTIEDVAFEVTFTDGFSDSDRREETFEDFEEVKEIIEQYADEDIETAIEELAGGQYYNQYIIVNVIKKQGEE